MRENAGIEKTVYAKSLDERPTNNELDAFDKMLEQRSEENIAKLKLELEEYRAIGNEKNMMFLVGEKHDSELLAKHLFADGMSKPGAGWAAHHMVSGKHKKAVAARLILARTKIRIDDADNGCWMPDEKICAHRTLFPNAVPHQNIHRTKYYNWIEGILRGAKTKLQAQAVLSMVRAQLLQGKIKKELIDEIEVSRYNNTLKKTGKRA